ncbi:unnamed protein product [Adineta steineri]|uniref:Uncharacterized protein n=1 Tax=Adineta steineri TaxID=433720 RepID=A0A814Y6Y9_9BILA|nr:unnamed protein product [Adineta steineri]CAF1516038.1 unnamed protein product [Adineta steineri]
MSNDYALFIIIIPNDFDPGNSVVGSTEVANIVKPQPRRASFDTVSALMAPAAIPLAISPSLSPLLEVKSENDILQSCQRSSPISICALLKTYLADRNDVDAVWLLSENRKTYQVTFYVEFGFVSDEMLQDLARLSIGKTNGTKIFVLPTTVIVKGYNDQKNRSLSSSLHTLDDSISTIDEKSTSIKEGHHLNHDHTLSRRYRKRFNESDFKKSVRARLMVHQVVASIRASTALSFDFVLLICLASVLAAFGLLENSTVIIVASMLVSPLMNPILGIVFGLSVRDQSLWRHGLRNEIIGLIICTTCGFIIGLFTTIFETKWGSSTSFPTSEMKSRGDGKRLWVGVFIALPSGAGVALSVLGGNTGSLVGVAISASLLPPAVNCGLLFAYSLLGTIFSRVVAIQSHEFNTTNNYNDSSIHCPKYINNDYQPLYTCNLVSEAAILGCCSLLLTIVNIICIIIMALIILRIKEVVPLHQPNKDIANFFHYDVRVARDYNKTIHEGDINLQDPSTLTVHKNNITQTIIKRWKSFKSSPSFSSTHQEQQQQQQQSNRASPTLSVYVDLDNHKNNLIPDDIESQQKFFRLQTLAKEYGLDLFNKDDYDLINSESRDKVRLLITDLIDMCQTVPSVFVDLYRLQPSGTQSSITDKEHMSFYQEIIEYLPPKWHQIFLYERQRRFITAWSLPFDRSYSMRSRPLAKRIHSKSNPYARNHHESLKQPNKKTRFRFNRQSSVPDSNVSSKKSSHDIEKPIQGTRFRISIPSTTAEMHGNESKLI